jgi:hypothetical protein
MSCSTDRRVRSARAWVLAGAVLVAQASCVRPPPGPGPRTLPALSASPAPRAVPPPTTASPAAVDRALPSAPLAAPCTPAAWPRPEGRTRRILVAGPARRLLETGYSESTARFEARPEGSLPRRDELIEPSNLRQPLAGCSDDPGGRLASAGALYRDDATGLEISVTAVEPAGKSGRGWLGARCSYRLRDTRDPTLYAALEPALVAPFNELSGVIRQGQAVFVRLSFNGYAAEIGGRGNYLVALDLCTHEVKWRSADLSSNAPFVVLDRYVVTGYGFTRERDWLYVLDRGSGTIVQRVALPNAPEALMVSGASGGAVLAVGLYAGELQFELTP